MYIDIYLYLFSMYHDFLKEIINYKKKVLYLCKLSHILWPENVDKRLLPGNILVMIKP